MKTDSAKGQVLEIVNGWATVLFKNGFTFDYWLFSADIKVGDTVHIKFKPEN